MYYGDLIPSHLPPATSLHILFSDNIKIFLGRFSSKRNFIRSVATRRDDAAPLSHSSSHYPRVVFSSSEVTRDLQRFPNPHPRDRPLNFSIIVKLRRSGIAEISSVHNESTKIHYGSVRRSLGRLVVSLLRCNYRDAIP